MTNGWTNSVEDGPNAIANIQRSLTVDLIMTPRDDLQTCRRDETANTVKSRNKGQFSFLPVVDKTEQFLGLYQADRWFGAEAPNAPISNDFQRFSEAVVIGADARIIDFVQVAHKQPARFVVSGDRIEGLVTLSDLQQLPARAALFTLITNLEMAMAQRIEAERWDRDPTSWLDLLSDGRRKRVVNAICEAKRDDTFVSAIVCTQLADKATIIVRKRLISGRPNALRRDFRAIVKLRNRIAHANYFAQTPTEAKETCETVGLILRIQEKLSESTRGMN